MKYYSESLKKLFDSEKELQESELAAQKKAEEKEKKAKELAANRKARANEIEDMLKERAALEKKIREKLADFTKDYGAFHLSYREPEDLFDFFFDHFRKFFDYYHVATSFNSSSDGLRSRM